MRLRLCSHGTYQEEAEKTKCRGHTACGRHLAKHAGPVNSADAVFP